MTRIVVSETAKKNHIGLLAGLVDAGDPPVGGARVLVCDADEPVPAHRKGDCVLKVETGAAVELSGNAARGMRLRYDPHFPSAAKPALHAALALPGMPIAADVATQALLTMAARIAESDIPVLVQGPTGTGKEVLARFLHARSLRADRPFVALNCAAMPEAMLETMLFGHRKGAFTGASEAHDGFFRAADGGTLLLDEIGEMPLALQAKLLRALQEGEVVPIGATAPVKVDVRIIACTNRDLAGEIGAGRFREDLFYRLNVFPLALPALRERPGDLAALAFGMALRHARTADAPVRIAGAALDRLTTHPWPGNVRELENVIRRAIVLAGEAVQIEAEHIHFDAAVSAVREPAALTPLTASTANAAVERPNDKGAASLSDIAFRSEAEAIIQTLAACGGHRGQTAKKLGISERTLRYRLADMRESGLALAGGRK